LKVRLPVQSPRRAERLRKEDIHIPKNNAGTEVEVSNNLPVEHVQQVRRKNPASNPE
jgi:hypothetical protein